MLRTKILILFSINSFNCFNSWMIFGGRKKDSEMIENIEEKLSIQIINSLEKGKTCL